MRQRQASLAKGKETAGITIRLGRIRENQEILEDTVVGFETKLDQLKKRPARDAFEAEAIEQEILNLKIIPKVIEYNRMAEPMGKLLEELFALIWQLGGNVNSVVFPSGDFGRWGGSLEEIPRLCFPGEGKLLSFFKWSSLKEEHDREVRKVLVKEL